MKRALILLTGLLILKVTAGVVIGYVNYFPPDFFSDFLQGRERYFFGSYQWAFYPHIASGPVSLVLGMILLSDRFRARIPRWHRRLGCVQVACVLLLVVPTGFWMAWYAQTGPVSGAAFAVLSALTGTCVALGWRAAVRKRFAVHRRWMVRGFVLLCSAVVVRVLGGLGTVLGVTSLWFDPISSWCSWLVPLIALELGWWMNTRAARQEPMRPALPRSSAVLDS